MNATGKDDGAHSMKTSVPSVCVCVAENNTGMQSGEGWEK